MGTLFTIAFRNILRHKRRTITSAITIAVGLMFLIFMDSIFAGMDKGATDNMIHLSASSVKIYTQQYYSEKESYPLQYGIDNQRKIEDYLRKYPVVTGVAPRAEFLAQLSNYRETKPVIGKVIHAALDTTVFSLIQYLQGAYFSADNSREIILGKDLAKEMGVTVGDNITLYALTRYDSRNADDFKVIGILNTTDPTINKNSVLITYQAANDFLDLENLITELNVSIKKQMLFKQETAIMKNIQSDLSNAFDNLKVLTFLEIGADFLNVAKQKQAWSWVYIVLILLIAAVGIFNTVLMSVFERIREIGVLRAHGFKPKDLTILFVLEGTITGLLGSALGVILGCLVNAYLVTVGIPFDKITGDIDVTGFPIWGTIYGQWHVGIIIAAFLFGVIVATMAGIIPARKAAAMAITQALRFV